MQIINKLGTDRIGIIAYSGSAFPVLPMTSDYNVAKMFLQGINTSIISSQGTSIDEAINLSTQYFNKKEKTRKLLVIISDGEDHSNNAVDAADDAKEAGIKIITVGVGSEKGAKIPLKENGLFSGYQQDKQGDIVVTKRDATMLNEIAKSTNGSYIDGNNTKNVVDFIIQKISKIEKTEFKNMQMANFKSQFQWFLAIAFFLLLLDTFITERKLEWFKKLNLFQKKETL
jgi:Ca-activated chloride channel family protein